MNKSHTLEALAAIILPGVLVYLSVNFVVHKYLNKAESNIEASQTIDCPLKGKAYLMVIENGVITPAHIDVKLCDHVTVMNADDKLREMAFGEHDSHVKYDGVTEKFLKLNESWQFDFNQLGNYQIHDHFQDDTLASFTVNN